jgi:hypothetical protein
MHQDDRKEAGMVKKVLAAAALVIGLLALAVPAQAKGEGGKITIGGGGGGVGGGGRTGGGGGGSGGGGGAGAALLAKPIHLNGRASAFWFEAAGFGQPKFDRPSTMGKPIAKDRLGPALSVNASFLCGAGERNSIHQVLYPYAKGGPQVYTPANQFMCGMDLQKGWWPAPYSDMFDPLVAQGLPKTLPAAFRSEAGAPTTGTASAGGSAWPLILAGVAALTLVLLSGAIVQWRKVRLPA